MGEFIQAVFTVTFWIVVGIAVLGFSIATGGGSKEKEKPKHYDCYPREDD